MTASKAGTTSNKQPALIVFGRIKGNAIDQAAYFAEKDVEAAKKAAVPLGLTALEVTTDAIRKACNSLQEGVINAQGRFSLSPISKAKLAELQMLLPAKNYPVQSSSLDPWANLKPGDLVLAAGFDDEDNLEGWYPAVVVKKDDGEYVVRWRDFPGEPNVSRTAEYLSLLHPQLQ